MKKKIIIVDDKIMIVKIIAAYLSAEYEFEYFDNPIPCLEKLETGTLPDLIISDILMPHMRGDIFLDKIKNSERLKNIPVIMLSSEDSSSERIRLLQNGAKDYIVKPFNPLELKIRIKKIFE
ncbi:MAG: response regulator [Odoribacter sp.]